MDGLIGLGGVLAILLAVGLSIGFIDRRHFNLRWLLIAVLLVALNDALLTYVYGAIPDIIGGAKNWQGKLLALLAALVVASFPAFGWRRCGLTLRQMAGSQTAVLPVVLLYCAFFAALALGFPREASTTEDTWFQLTMPGLAEECFYRGVLLLTLDRAFTGRRRMLGVDWGWGAVLSSCLFGMDHAFGFSGGAFAFDPVSMGLTAIPALLAVWIRQQTGSVAIPVVLHNFGNALSLLI